jgi:endo-1,4-beta-D-glucanase Y
MVQSMGWMTNYNQPNKQIQTTKSTNTNNNNNSDDDNFVAYTLLLLEASLR